MKVFLSHSGKDKAFVLQLEAEMKAAGLTTWLYEVDIDQGQNFVAEINRGLTEADLVVLIWSPAAAASRWTEIEWTSALRREVNESRTRLGIIRLHEHPVPEILGTKIYVDARADATKGRADALAWFERQRDMLLYQSRDAAFQRLPHPPPGFLGRITYLERLHEELVPLPARVLLHGEPGDGKTTLANKFAWAARGAFHTIVFQYCGQRDAVAITSDLAEKLDESWRPLQTHEKAQRIRQRLQEHRALLVLDDAWTIESVRDLLPEPPVSVLVTSRFGQLDHWHARLKLTGFSPEEQRDYFARSLAGWPLEALLAIGAQMQGKPLALNACVQQLEASPLSHARAIAKLSFADPIAIYRTAAATQPEPHQRLLRALAACAPQGVWLRFAAEVAGLSEEEAEESAVQLYNANLLTLVDRGAQTYAVHALMREALAGESAEAHARVTDGWFAKWEERWRDCERVLAEVDRALDWLGREDTGRFWMLAYHAFYLTWRTGSLDAALGYLQRYEGVARQRGDKGNLQVSYGNQAVILKAWGRLDEAMALHKQKVELCRELGNKDGLQASYANQAGILYSRGRLDEALALYKQQEELCRELGNKDGLQISYGGQALILKDWGRLDEAMALLKQQEGLCRDLGNKNDLQISYGNQALILKDWSRLDEAMALLQRQEELCRELGSKNGLQISYGNQALILKDWGRLDEAMALHKQKEELCRDLGNRAHLAYSFWNQGLVRNQQAPPDAGRPLLEQALAIFTELRMPRERDGVQRILDGL